MLNSLLFIRTERSHAQDGFASQDGVLFHVHSAVLLKYGASSFQSIIAGTLDENRFRRLILPIPLASPILNTVLHILYDLSPVNHSPSIKNIVEAVNTMPSLSLSSRETISPECAFYKHLLAMAPLYPMDIFTLAAQHNIHQLAVDTSAHLLSYPLEDITDEQAERMGASYLLKLVSLRIRRFDSLKSILLRTLLPHAPIKTCGFSEQKKLTRAWALTTASSVWDSRLDLSTYTIQLTLAPLTEDIECAQCKQLLKTRIDEVIHQWTEVQRTI